LILPREARQRTETLARRAMRRGEQTIALAPKKSGSPFWCVYCTKSEPILNRKRTNRARGARGGSKLNRTLGQSPRHRLASLGNTKKEKMFLAFLFSRG